MAAEVVVDVRRAEDRFTTVGDGRSTAHSFSFGAHYVPDDVGLGPLIVHNDDVLAPGAGYAPHEHRDVEIVTWVLEGALRHEDRLGHTTFVTPGRVQVLDAGPGVVHAEWNAAEGATRFVQVWLRPEATADSSSYAVADVAPGHGPVVVASGVGPAPVTLRTRAELAVARLRRGETLALPTVRGHVFLATGSATLVSADAGTRLAAGDALRLRSVPGDGAGVADEAIPPVLTASTDCEVLVWTLP